MKLGTENKKQVLILIGLVSVAVYFIYSSFFSGSPAPATAPAPAPTRAAAAAVPGSAPEAEVQPSAPRAPSNSGRSDEFKPKLRSKRPEDRVDPIHVDPTLRLDLLARLQEVPAPGGSHNLFLIAPPPLPKPMPIKDTGPTVAVQKWRFPQPLPPPPPPPPPPAPKQPVPINVKYYGWVSPIGSDRKRAFFLDGDDVIVKSEGEAIKGHYRVVRIGPTSVVVVDTNDKLEQTLKKAEDAAV
jgi:hypothetical protein